MAKVELEVPDFKKPPRAKKQAPTGNKKEIKQVTSAKTKPQGLGKKFLDTFISEDVEDVKSYVIFDVIIPNVKDGIMDLLNMMFFGDTGRRRRGGYYTNEKTSYSAYYKSDRDRERRKNEPRRRSCDVPEIIVDTRMDANDVIEEMNNLIDEYDSVSVADLNQIVGITGSYTDEHYGWYDISSVRIRRANGGYLIDLPRPKPID